RKEKEILYTKISRAKIPKRIQARVELTAAIKNTARKSRIPRVNFTPLPMEKNSIKYRTIIPKNPVKRPKVFQDPTRLSIFPPSTPKESGLGPTKRAAWNMSTMAEEKI